MDFVTNGPVAEDVWRMHPNDCIDLMVLGELIKRSECSEHGSGLQAQPGLDSAAYRTDRNSLSISTQNLVPLDLDTERNDEVVLSGGYYHYLDETRKTIYLVKAGAQLEGEPEKQCVKHNDKDSISSAGNVAYETVSPSDLGAVLYRLTSDIEPKTPQGYHSWLAEKFQSCSKARSTFPDMPPCAVYATKCLRILYSSIITLSKDRTRKTGRRSVYPNPPARFTTTIRR